MRLTLVKTEEDRMNEEDGTKARHSLIVRAMLNNDLLIETLVKLVGLSEKGSNAQVHAQTLDAMGHARWAAKRLDELKKLVEGLNTDGL